MQEQIERDLKAALLAGNKLTVETLKGIKNAFQYEAVAKSAKASDLSDEQMIMVLARESKKRQEAADLYSKAGEAERAAKELAEKSIVDKFLPAPIPNEELVKIIESEIAKIPRPTMADMGKIIGAVRAKTAGAADGAQIAQIVKSRLEKQGND